MLLRVRSPAAGRLLWAALPCRVVRQLSVKAWWEQFRKEWKEESESFPTPKGYVNLNPIQPEKWEKLSKGEFQYALKQALIEWSNDWRYLFSSKYRDEVHELDERARKIAAGIDPDAPEDEVKVEDQPPVTFTAEDVRAGAFHAAKRLKEATEDQDLRQRLAAMGTSALRTARDSLDAFLIGYAEGKHAEVRAWLEEEEGREQETKERVKRVRAQVEAELSARMAAQMAAGSSEAQTPTAGPAGQAPADDGARLSAAAKAALSSISAEPALQSLVQLAEAVTGGPTAAKAADGQAQEGGAPSTAAAPSPGGSPGPKHKT